MTVVEMVLCESNCVMDNNMYSRSSRLIMSSVIPSAEVLLLPSKCNQNRRGKSMQGLPTPIYAVLKYC